MSKTPTRKSRCLHIPAKPTTLQTVCVLCGREIEPITPDSNRWRLLS